MMDEQERRAAFQRWLVTAWDWAGDHGRIACAEAIAEILSHADEPDYPLWGVARKHKVIGDSLSAQAIQRACGPFPDGPTASDWEKAINFSPTIYLEETVWRHIHGSLGWANRDHLDTNQFWLWSNGGNVVRFAIRGKP